jgi:hypothetical protein
MFVKMQQKTFDVGTPKYIYIYYLPKKRVFELGSLDLKCELIEATKLPKNQTFVHFHIDSYTYDCAHITQNNIKKPVINPSHLK